MNNINKNIDTLQNSIIPKFLNIFNDENKRKKVQKYFSALLPEKVINISQEEYVYIKNFSKEEIIKNSIQYSELDVDEKDLEYLFECFTPILDNPRVRIDTNTNIAIYLEVVQLLNYAKQIRELIDNHPKNNSNNYGTKYRSSSEKSLIKVHLLHLRERLNNPFFKLDDPKLIAITQEQIRLIELFQTKEYKSLSNALNWTESFLGLENKILNLTSDELKGIRQVLSLFNGIRTTKEAYVKSFMIFVCIQCNLDTKDNKMNVIYANSILDIAKYFFHDIFILDSKKSKKTLNFTKNSLTKEWYNKTIINNVPIFAYKTRNQIDFLIKQAMTGIADMMKLSTENIFDKDSSNELTITSLKNLYRALEKFNFTKKDTRTLIKLSQLMNEQSLLQASSTTLTIK